MNAMNTPTLQFNYPLVAPVVTIPPVLGDVANIALHRQRVVKRKLEEPLAISDDDVANVIIAEHAVVQNVGGAQVAPPWFAPAMAAALENALAPLQVGIATLQKDVTAIRADVATLQTDVVNLTARSNNSLSVADTDPLLPVAVGGVPPANFPADIAALRSLSGAPLHDLEDYYGLPHDHSEGRRRFRLAKKLGVQVPLVRQMTVPEELLGDDE
eukprot:gene12506-8941_t